MKHFIYIAIACTFIGIGSLAHASKNNFQYQINNYHTKRQAGQTLDVNVRYALHDGVDEASFPDYRDLRVVSLSYLEPTAELPVNTYWEVIAAKMAEDLMSRYHLVGVSVQLLVHTNENGAINEPGYHGPIYTVGDVIPFSESVAPKQ